MSDRNTIRTKRGLSVQSFLEPALGLPMKTLRAGDRVEALRQLRGILTPDRHISIMYAIQRNIVPRLQKEDMALPEGKRRLIDALNQDARREIIRDFDSLLFLCLHLGFLDVYDDVVAEIVKIPELRLQEYRSPTQYYLPRNLLAPYRAIGTAFRTGRPVADILGWDANASEDRIAHHVSRAGELLRDLQDADVLRPEDPGYARIMGMRMTDAGGASAVRTADIAPVPVVPPEESLASPIPMIQETLIFTGDEQIRKWKELLEIANRHGGVEAFLLHIVDVVKQRPKT